MNEKILVINNGSTSFRFSLVQTSPYKVLAFGGAENIATDNSYFRYDNFFNYSDKKIVDIDNVESAIMHMKAALFDKDFGVISSAADISAIGFRVVHGGEEFNDSIIINSDFMSKLKDLSSLMPLHGENIIKSINGCNDLFNCTSIAVFDTSFHKTIPRENYLYALPMSFYEKYGIRKYGFHGISYSSVLRRYSEIIGKLMGNINTIICHMGGGCSICAVKDGKSFDTTMGFTPVSGMIMASRCGDIDPLIVPYLVEHANLNFNEVIRIINEESGYKAICGDKDAKSIVERSLASDDSAILLRKMADVDFKKHLLSMMSNLDYIDSIIITGGMGTKNKEQRELFLSNLENFGIRLDKKLNDIVFDTEALISAKDSNIPIFVIPDNEEKEIVRECVKVMRRR